MAEHSGVAQRAAGIRPPAPRKEGLGQLVYPFERDLAFCAVTYLRTPTRVLWDVYRSRARRLEPLYDELCADIARDQPCNTAESRFRRYGRRQDPEPCSPATSRCT